MPLTLEQATPLAALVHQLRPEWDERGILKALEKCAGRNLFDVAAAAIRAAADRGAKTPGVIPSDGPHWRERVSDQLSPRNPMPHEECPHHVGQFRLACSGCHADKLAGERSTAPSPLRVLNTTVAVAQAREALYAAKADLCAHGVHPRLCKDRSHDEPAPEQETEEPA